MLAQVLSPIAVTNKNIHENTTRVSLKCLQAKPSSTNPIYVDLERPRGKYSS